VAKEIERKFLLADDSWRALAARRAEIRQGYLANGERISVRVRVSERDAWLNIKLGGLAAVRDEFEYPIPFADARALLDSIVRQPLIEKTRHWVAHGGFEWEIDEFHGSNEGLIVAEIELDFEDQAFPHPAWIGREVTHLPHYYNVNLVDHPYARWDEQERDQ
jgi:adenylate cyclase